MNPSIKKVVIVEEDPVEAGILEFYLDRAGLQTHVVHTMAEAQDLADPVTPFAYLTEATGEDIDWAELAHATLGYPCIFMVLTDVPLSAQDEFQAMRYGVAEIFVKPVDPKILVERIRRFRPIPLGSGSIGVPGDACGGDLADRHAQTLLDFCRRHAFNGLLEIDLNGRFGGILIKQGKPLDAWLGDARGRSALNAILMLEAGPFVLFFVDEDSEQLDRENVIGEDDEPGSWHAESPQAVPTPEHLHYDDGGALPPAPPAEVATRPKRRRRFSTQSDLVVDPQPAAPKKLPALNVTEVDPPSLPPAGVRAARDRRDVISLVASDTLISEPPPIPPPDPPAESNTASRASRRRETLDEIATASVSHVEFSDTRDTIDELPIAAPEADFFDQGTSDEVGAESWETSPALAHGWLNHPWVTRGLLGIWLLLLAFVCWRLVGATEPDQELPTTTPSAQAAELLAEGANAPDEEIRTRFLSLHAQSEQAAAPLAGLGVLAFKAEDWKATTAHFQRALVADPTLIEAHWFLSLAALASGDETQALSHGRSFLEVEGEGEASNLLRGKLGL